MRCSLDVCCYLEGFCGPRSLMNILQIISPHWRPRARFLRFGVFGRESLICMIYWSSSSLKLIYETKHMGGLNVA